MHLQRQLCKLYWETFSARIDCANSRNGFLLLRLAIRGSSEAGRVWTQVLEDSLPFILLAGSSEPLVPGCEQTQTFHQPKSWASACPPPSCQPLLYFSLQHPSLPDIRLDISIFVYYLFSSAINMYHEDRTLVSALSPAPRLKAEM